MKKIMFFMIVFFTLGFASVSANAAPLESEQGQETALREVEVSITGGMKDDGTVESTFDDSRTISGSAEDGTEICIDVFTKTAGGTLKENSTYNVSVGVTGLFSQTVNLEIGENVVIVSASKDDCETVTESATIKRKRKAIKTTLENGISIPGINSGSSGGTILYIR